jgi:hypothetical protein
MLFFSKLSHQRHRVELVGRLQIILLNDIGQSPRSVETLDQVWKVFVLAHSIDSIRVEMCIASSTTASVQEAFCCRHCFGFTRRQGVLQASHESIHHGREIVPSSVDIPVSAMCCGRPCSSTKLPSLLLYQVDGGPCRTCKREKKRILSLLLGKVN